MDTATPPTPATADPAANSATKPATTPVTKSAPESSVRSAATSVDDFLGRSAARVPSGPLSPRAIAVALVATFIVGGVLGGAMPLWVLVLIGLVVGALALFAMDRYGRSRH